MPKHNYLHTISVFSWFCIKNYQITYPISILYDGLDGMFVHADISGSAILDVIEHFQNKRSSLTPFNSIAYETDSFTSTVFSDLLREISAHGHITRLDLAIDDTTTQFFSMSELHSIFSSGNYVSKFRKWKELTKFEDASRCTGHTIYLGSRESSVMFRIYDKQLEQNEKLLKNGNLPITHSWVRWEMELKQERAQEACRRIMEGSSVNEVAIGILSNYLRIIEPDNERKSRCSTSAKWKSFIDGISKVSLYCSSEPKTLEDTKRWLVRQVAPSLAAVVTADEGDLSFIQSLVHSGAQRFSIRHLQMLESALALEDCA